jgi:hypothetical protein
MGTENNIQNCKCEDKTTNYHLTVCEKGMKNDDSVLNKKDFHHELEKLINCHSKENISNTPDWVIASYLVRCLDVFDDCIKLRERYYGRQFIKKHIPIVKPSETLTALLCGPSGEIAIDFCVEEKRMLKDAIQKIKLEGL